MTVLQGIVTIYGAVIQPNSPALRVYAPSIQALPPIQARQAAATIRLSSVNPCLRKLEALSPLFRNMWSHSASNQSFAFLRSSADDPLQRILEPLDINREFDAVLRTLSAKSSIERSQPRIMAIGAKASGKSTFNRVLWNHLRSWTSHKKCHFLDIDPGQPEFGPPGTISLVEVSAPLLGPPFTHPASSECLPFRLLRSHAIAATSFKDDPEHYQACVLDVASHIDRKHPLIVNFCGWVAGTGADVLKDLIDDLSISDAVLLEPLDTEIVDFVTSNSDRRAVHRISRRQPRPSSRTPAEQRAMQTMACFHSRLSTHGDVRWSGKAITAVRPWIVSYGGNQPGILAVLSYGNSPAPEFLTEVLNGSIVAVNIVDDEEAGHIASKIQQTPEQLPFIQPDDRGLHHTLTPSRSKCNGLALVRGIDSLTKNLLLVSPLPSGEIADLNDKNVVLVRGSFDLPEWAYLEDFYIQNGAEADFTEVERPWVSERGLVGIEGAVWRLRHPPLANNAATPNR